MLGTGDRILFMQQAREALAKLGIQVDIQDTVVPFLYGVDERKMLRVCLICYRLRGEVLLLLC